ncbi:MAG: N-acetylmuramoyl-L-alanine amidase [Candidatus Saccharimonadia bacterium]
MREARRTPTSIDSIRVRQVHRPIPAPLPPRPLVPPRTPVPPRNPVTANRKPAQNKGLKKLIWVTVLFSLIILVGIFYPHHNKTITAVAAKIQPKFTKTQTVCLDPGHGGDDPGASSNDGSMFERNINLTVALQVSSILEHGGYRVYMTRTSNDPTMSNHDRYTYCNNLNATIMVSIHHNYFTDPTVDYDTALFYKDVDQALATSILNATSAKLNVPNDGISQFDDGVLSESTMPAALSEAFFMTDTNEFNLMTEPSSTRLSDEADGIATGIENYFTQPKAAQPLINTNPQVINRAEAND